MAWPEEIALVVAGEVLMEKGNYLVWIPRKSRANWA